MERVGWQINYFEVEMSKPVKNFVLGIKYQTEEYCMRIPLQTTVTVY